MSRKPLFSWLAAPSLLSGEPRPRLDEDPIPIEGRAGIELLVIEVVMADESLEALGRLP